MSALQKRLLGRHGSLAFLRGVFRILRAFSDLFGIPSLSGSYRRTGPHGSCPQPVNRIVSLAPSLTETVYALGCADQSRRRYRILRLPADAQKKTKVGGGINPSLELIANLHPDIVLVTKAFNRLETVQSLENLGISS